MTKADRQELEDRLRKMDHYRRLALETCIHYGLSSKRDTLAKLRAED